MGRRYPYGGGTILSVAAKSRAWRFAALPARGRRPFFERHAHDGAPRRLVYLLHPPHVSLSRWPGELAAYCVPPGRGASPARAQSSVLRGPARFADVAPRALVTVGRVPAGDDSGARPLIAGGSFRSPPLALRLPR